MSGKFELYKDVRNRFRFRLKTDEDESILTSDGYEKKAFALDAIVSVMKNAPEAAIIDQTAKYDQLIEPEDSLLFEDAMQDQGLFWEQPQAMAETKPKKKKKRKRRRKDKAKKEKKKKAKSK